ncbi:hypothetical protein CBM2609_B40112 [Cupriavidus taiwanensis]|nr:hypothetical protein CBM2604_B50110 [Cupriavidus taiwanensis]SOZ32929.1 hypothetical protein CBM2609_B40112 [Cupriavidus taiwanensis]SOZ48350.1 hypothetical protein CBM2610_B40110 [Cupriavidus taiwanensis]
MRSGGWWFDPAGATWMCLAFKVGWTNPTLGRWQRLSRYWWDAYGCAARAPYLRSTALARSASLRSHALSRRVRGCDANRAHTPKAPSERSEALRAKTHASRY